MQGVRSTRGCLTCRRRKKGCDFQRPACGRCQHLKTTCRYEDRQFTFVADSRQSPGHSPPRNHATTALQPAVLPHPGHSPLIATDIDLQVDVAFWDVYLPREDPMLDGSIGGVCAAPWIPTVRALAKAHSNVRTAVDAVAYAGLGWWREDASLTQHGLRLYAQAIRETNQMLQDPAETLSDAALASCRTLSLFEMFRRGPGAPDTGSSQAVDWRSHAEGTFRLLELRGVEKHTSGNGFNLYDGVRMTAIISGIARRQPNTFTSLLWELAKPKTLRDELFDSMSMVPSLLQQIDEFSALNRQTAQTENREQKILQGNELLQRGLTVCMALRAWALRASTLCKEASPSTAGSPPDHDSEVPDEELYLFDVCKSHGYGFFFLCNQHWAMSIKVYTAVLHLQQQFLILINGFATSVPQIHIPHWVKPEPYAHYIAATAAHYFSPDAGLWAAQAAIFPIGTALLHFAQSDRGDSHPFQKMDDAYSNSKSGAIMRDFLKSTGFYVKRYSRLSG